ncbi:hypothetical protein J2W28_003129 [Variovorax boronicumulans]|nr:hypothetical protein [Variovorax boronicumulans]MDQ0003978.1 hypothetical protein [Variovorax boronicumulans]
MLSVSRFSFRGRVSPRQATYFLLLRQKNVSKEKATLLSATLRFATGNLRCSRSAGSRPNSLRSNKGEPSSAKRSAPQRIQKGFRTRHRCARLSSQFGPSLRLALTASNRPNKHKHTTDSRRTRARACPPVGPSEAMARSVPKPLWLRRGAQRFADQGSPLSERSEFGETPRTASTAGCPVAQRRGRRQRGRLFFAYFLLAKQKKVSRPPGRDPASAPRQGQTA